MEIVKFVIRHINNAKQGNQIFTDFQKENPNYYDFHVVVAPDAEFGYFMTISYKEKE